MKFFRKKNETFDEKIAKAIPANIQIFTLTPDTQLPKDANNVDETTLPKSYGKAGGSGSFALLQVLRRHTSIPEGPLLTHKQLLPEVKQNLETHYHSTQLPMLLASRKFAVDDPFELVPYTHHGKKYALLIAVGYNGSLPKANDAVLSWSDYLIRQQNFSPSHITILSDSSSSAGEKHLPPTHGNIINACRHIAQTAREGDVVVVQFVGHCSLIKPKSTKPALLFPSDYASQPNNPITQDDLLRTLIVPLRAGVHMTVILDTCHGAGTNVLPHPYSYTLSPDRTERDEIILEAAFEVIGGAAALVVLGSVVAAVDATDCCDASICHGLFDCGPLCC